MQTASYGILVSNPNWPNDGSCTVIFAKKVGESPTTSCGTVAAAGGNLLTPEQANAQRAGYAVSQVNNTTTQETASSLRVTTTGGGSSLTPTSYPTVQGSTAYHFESTMSSPATNTKNVFVLAQCYDAGNAVTGTYSGNNITPGTTGISSVNFTTTGTTTRCGVWPLQVSGGVAGEYFIVSKVGMWAGTGGQWAPPGQPIYQ